MLYCQKTVKECYWTKTGKCKGKYPYDCDANLSQEERNEQIEEEHRAERQAEMDAGII